jgi:FkbM family methyltransferase
MAILGLRRTVFNNSPGKFALKAVARFIPLEYLAGITQREVFRVKIKGYSFLYEFSGHDSIGEPLYWRGGSIYEPEAISFFVQHLATARTVLDIGANTGVYSLLALTSNPECRVVAWEPFPGTYEKLVRNIELNGLQARAELRCEAAAESDGMSFLEPHENWAMHTVSTIPSNSSISVRSSTVDSVVPSDVQVDLIKIDVEGREYEVLCGAKRVLAESRPAILIEIQPSCPTRDQTMAFFETMGYSVSSIDAHANWIALPVRKPPAR